MGLTRARFGNIGLTERWQNTNYYSNRQLHTDKGQGREKHRTIYTRHYLPISQTQRIAFRDKTSNLILLVALPSKLDLLVPAPHSVWSS